MFNWLGSIICAIRGKHSWKKEPPIEVCRICGKEEAIPTPTPTPVPTPTPTPTPVTSPYEEVPESMRGGECPTPGGKDIRFDAKEETMGTGKQFYFVGDLCAPHCVVSRQADGKLLVQLLDFKATDKDGTVYLIHVHSYNYPSSSNPKVSGNSCTTWGGDGTFRFYVSFHKA